MISKTWAVLGCSLLMLTACGSRDEADVAVVNGANEVNNVVDAATATTTSAVEFATAVAASDLFEIESGNLAAEKAKSADVKSFAQMLVADHQESSGDLKTATASASPPITFVAALDAEKQGMLESLKNAQEADFDRSFLEQQRQAHEKALGLLRQYEATGDNESLKAFATKGATVVQAHLDKLNQLKP